MGFRQTAREMPVHFALAEYDGSLRKATHSRVSDGNVLKKMKKL